MKLIIEFEDPKRIYKIPLELILKEIKVEQKTVEKAVRKLLSKS